MSTTHEQYVQAVRDEVIRLQGPGLTLEEVQRLHNVKLIYGIGQRFVRGSTHYGAWTNGHVSDLVEITAVGEENWIQLAGTTIHELGHVISQGDGHGRTWKNQSERLGLRRAKAAGMRYTLAALDPEVREAVWKLAQRLDDGAPSWLVGGAGGAKGSHGGTLRPCSAGVGTRGGASRGAGSGSRSLKVSCSTCGYVARVTRTWLNVGAPYCGTDLDHGRMEEGA